MLDAARVTRGTQVLDACCGPAMLAAGALERGAEAVGLNFSSAAVELARRLVEQGAWPTPQRFPSIRTGACSMRSVTLNPFLLARSALAPFLPLNRVRRRLMCAPIWPTI